MYTAAASYGVCVFLENKLPSNLNKLICVFLLLVAKSVLTDPCPQKQKFIQKYFEWPPVLLYGFARTNSGKIPMCLIDV